MSLLSRKSLGKLFHALIDDGKMELYYKFVRAWRVCMS